MLLALILALAGPDLQAQILLENFGQEHYVGREAAIMLDDSFELRKAMKRRVAILGLMKPEEVTMFDEGFGACCWGLGYAREMLQIKRAEQNKRKID